LPYYRLILADSKLKEPKNLAIKQKSAENWASTYKGSHSREIRFKQYGYLPLSHILCTYVVFIVQNFFQLQTMLHASQTQEHKVVQDTRKLFTMFLRLKMWMEDNNKRSDSHHFMRSFRTIFSDFLQTPKSVYD